MAVCWGWVSGRGRLMVPAVWSASAGGRSDDGGGRRSCEDGCRGGRVGGRVFCSSFCLVLLVRAANTTCESRLWGSSPRLFRRNDLHVRLLVRIMRRCFTHLVRLLPLLRCAQGRERGRVACIEAARRALVRSGCFREALALGWRRVERSDCAFGLCSARNVA